MANESLLITMLPDGTFHVKETEPAGDDDGSAPAIDQSVQSAEDVTALVQQWLQGEAQDDASEPADSGGSASGGDPASGGALGDDMSAPAPTKSAWNAEASKRDPSTGLRK